MPSGNQQGPPQILCDVMDAGHKMYALKLGSFTRAVPDRA